VKNERQEKIIKLVAEKEIKTQEMLCEELQKAGYRVTQATVSRDIKELALKVCRSSIETRVDLGK